MDKNNSVDILEIASKIDPGIRPSFRLSGHCKFLLQRIRILITTGNNKVLGLLFIISKALKINNSFLQNYGAITILDYFFQNKSKNPVILFDKPFYYIVDDKPTIYSEYASFMSMLTLILAIVIDDQYGLKTFKKSYSTIIDAGAQIGVFSVYANYFNPNATIYSFEPSKKIFNLLAKNTQNSQNIKIFNLALGESEKTINLLTGNKNPLYGGDAIENSEMVLNQKEKFLNTEEIKMTTIDKLVETNNIQSVDFIKIDTEGYEKNILLGAKETIKKFSPIIVCSAYHLKNDKIEIPKLIKSIDNNYQYHLTKKWEEDFIFYK